MRIREVKAGWKWFEKSLWKWIFEYSKVGHRNPTQPNPLLHNMRGIRWNRICWMLKLVGCRIGRMRNREVKAGWKWFEKSLWKWIFEYSKADLNIILRIGCGIGRMRNREVKGGWKWFEKSFEKREFEYSNEDQRIWVLRRERIKGVAATNPTPITLLLFPLKS